MGGVSASLPCVWLWLWLCLIFFCCWFASSRFLRARMTLSYYLSMGMADTCCVAHSATGWVLRVCVRVSLIAIVFFEFAQLVLSQCCRCHLHVLTLTHPLYLSLAYLCLWNATGTKIWRFGWGWMLRFVSTYRLSCQVGLTSSGNARRSCYAGHSFS